VAGLLGDIEKVNCAYAGGKQRLVGVTPGGVHEQAALVVADSFGKGLGALLENNLAPTLGARLRNVDLVSGIVQELGNDNLTLELRLTDLTLDAASVDSHVAKIGEELLSTVLAADEVEKFRSVINERGPAVATDEGIVREEGALPMMLVNCPHKTS